MISARIPGLTASDLFIVIPCGAFLTAAQGWIADAQDIHVAFLAPLFYFMVVRYYGLTMRNLQPVDWSV